jgi:PadR family transcriptional regulator PadR
MTFQVGSALLDACALAVINRSDAYGYSLTRSLKSVIEVSESSLYPVLRRLRNDNLLTVYDVSHDGRNRRYYRVTEDGKTKLAEFAAEWRIFKERVDKIFSGGDDADGINLEIDSGEEELSDGGIDNE